MTRMITRGLCLASAMIPAVTRLPVGIMTSRMKVLAGALIRVAKRPRTGRQSGVSGKRLASATIPAAASPPIGPLISNGQSLATAMDHAARPRSPLTG